MLYLLEDLPVELVGATVLGYLSIHDIVMLERACSSKTSHRLLLHLILYHLPVSLPARKHIRLSSLIWFDTRRCKLSSITLSIPQDNPALRIQNLLVDNIVLRIASEISIYDCYALFVSKLRYKVKEIKISTVLDKKVMKLLSIYTPNVEKLCISSAHNQSKWLKCSLLSRWRLTGIEFMGSLIMNSLMLSVVQRCSALTSIKLKSENIDDAAVIAIAHHCPNLETLSLSSNTVTWTSLLALSERGLPLKTLHLSNIPSIPTADIARRCSHALSCMRSLSTSFLHSNRHLAHIIISYMTGLSTVYLNCPFYSYIPLLTHHYHKLTKIEVLCAGCSVADILSLCRANPLLKVLRIRCKGSCGITDTALIQFIHACPHIYTLDFPYETDITDIGVLALSEQCTVPQELSIANSKQVTEAAILQLLQRCWQLKQLFVSKLSLSAEAAAEVKRTHNISIKRY